jgi:hypothetical protein
MLSSISWSEYFTTLLISLLLYYIVVGLLFFRADIIALVNRNSSIFKSEKSNVEDSHLNSIPHELMNQLNTVSENNYENKEELLTALKGKLKLYPGLQNKTMKNSISEFLQHNYPQLDEMDIKRIWN